MPPKSNFTIYLSAVSHIEWKKLNPQSVNPSHWV